MESTSNEMAAEPFFIEKAWCSETATPQLNPPSKRKAESITYLYGSPGQPPTRERIEVGLQEQRLPQDRNPCPAHFHHLHYRDATPAAAMATTPSRIHCCTKCHARGHQVDTCRTTNPAAMRKRVAENARRKKMASNPSFMPFASPSSPFPLYGPYPLSTSNPVAAYAFVADAQELRRRRQQSDRDKRRVRRSTNATTS